MRKTVRALAILTLAALVAPEVRWAALRTNAEPFCACPPAACMCPGHPHALGRTLRCGMANGGQCGLESPESYLRALLNTLVYMPIDHAIYGPLQCWGIGESTPRLNPLPSHAQVPEQPPRVTL